MHNCAPVSTRLICSVAPLLTVPAHLYLLALSPLRLRKSPRGFYFRFRVLAGAAGAGRAQHPGEGEVHRAQVRLVRHVVAVVSVAWSGLRLSQILRTSIKIPYR